MQRCTKDSMRKTFDHDGFVISPPLVEPDLIGRARQHIRMLMSGVYETGVDPGYPRAPAQIVKDEPRALYRLYQAHLADNTIRELVTHPAVARCAAALCDTDWVQLWGTTFLYKPSGVAEQGNIGWHQDAHYFTNIWTADSEVFFCSLALSDIEADSGPVLMIRGSHRWGYLGQGDFYGQDMKQVRGGIGVPPDAAWEEVPATMPAGAVSIHDKNTFHGSMGNRSGKPRLSILLELRTRNSAPISGSDSYYVKHLDDPVVSPVIYPRP